MNWKTIFFVLVLFTSCTNDEVKIPNEILSEENMKNLLVEIHLSDALAADERIKDVKLLNEIKKAYFTSVLEANNISEAAFDKSLAFYQEHPSVLFEIYEKDSSVSPAEITLTQTHPYTTHHYEFCRTD